MMDIDYFLNFAKEIQSQQDQVTRDWKERIRDEWQETKKMPRKMKKKVRKNLTLEWYIADYDPFNGFRI